MFYYFGRKGRLAPRYPAPRYELVIEPFAGSAAYSLHWEPPAALLIDSDPQVVALWDRLTSMSVREIESAPPLVVGERTGDLWHLTAMASKGTATTYPTKVSLWGARSFEWSRKVAIRNHPTAQRFDYRLGDYTQAPDIEATWFIDPPYQRLASDPQRGYNHPTVDFDALAGWCQTRRGQVIVCEQEGADWLPFRPFHTHTNSTNKPSREVWWTNEWPEDA